MLMNCRDRNISLLYENSFRQMIRNRTNGPILQFLESQDIWLPWMRCNSAVLHKLFCYNFWPQKNSFDITLKQNFASNSNQYLCSFYFILFYDVIASSIARKLKEGTLNLTRNCRADRLSVNPEEYRQRQIGKACIFITHENVPNRLSQSRAHRSKQGAGGCRGKRLPESSSCEAQTE